MQEERVKQSNPANRTRIALVLALALVVLLIAAWAFSTYLTPSTTGAPSASSGSGSGIELRGAEVKLEPLSAPPLEFVPIVQLQPRTPGPVQQDPTQVPEMQVPYLRGELRCTGTGSVNGVEIRYSDRQGSSSSTNTNMSGTCPDRESRLPDYGSFETRMANLVAGDIITISLTLTTTNPIQNGTIGGSSGIHVSSEYEMGKDGKLYKR